MKILIATLMVLSTTSFSQVRNPLGEQADYLLDRDSSRTSSVIKNGSLETRVVRFLPENADGAAYEVQINYDFDIIFYGRKSGTKVVEVPVDYFSPEFLRTMRERGTFEHPKFKMRHMGFADATNMDGTSYPNCDVLFMYDIDTNDRNHIFSPEVDDLEDLEITIHVSYGTPVLGAVKLDVSGTYSGVFAKAGADIINGRF